MANKKRLIDVNKVKSKAILLEGLDGNGIPYEVMAVTVDALDDTPIVDAVEVVHGRWVKVEVDLGGGIKTHKFACSECGFLKNTLTGNYCPNCGAKMDGDESVSNQ